MAVSIVITDGTGEIGDVVSGWSVNSATTPANPNVIPETTGSVSFTATIKPDTVFIVDDEVSFVHEFLGTVQGFVGDITITDNSVSGFINKKLALLDVERNMPPTSELPLSEIIQAYVEEVTDQVTVSYIATTDPYAAFPGWSGSVWQRINELCALYSLEVSVSSGTLIIRDMGTQQFTIPDQSNVSRTINTRSAGLFIDVVYQQSELVSSDSTYKWNYSQNPSVETNSTNWATTNGAYGTINSADRDWETDPQSVC